MKRYRHLFFDLDHTLWDFRANSRVVLRQLFDELALASQGVSDAPALIEVYEEINAGLWERYERGHIDKSVMRVLRFRNTLLHFGVRDDRLATLMGEAYLDRTPRMSALNDGALALLEDLRPLYGLHIITNGFAEVQETKLLSSRIRHLVDHVITSEGAGANKPDERIFRKALKLAHAEVQECLMIGDSITADMDGARRMGMDHAHYAPHGSEDQRATYRLKHLDDLRPILI